jgi:hypothetical protein
MTITSSNPPSSLINHHPPLAHDAQGCKVAVPAGTTHWRILRFTAGRPKIMPGRFDLELTPEQLLEMCGAGRYRIEALDEVGKPLAEVATVIVGIPSDVAAAVEPVANQNTRLVVPNGDTRYFLDTIAQMSRAHSESLQSLANAQADWIKTLATAKQLPRNAAPAPLMLPAPPSAEPDEPEPWWTHLLKPQTLMVVDGLLRNFRSMFGAKQETPEPAKRRNASALAQIAERTTAKPEPDAHEKIDLDGAFERAYEQLYGKKPGDASTEKSS